MHVTLTNWRGVTGSGGLKPPCQNPTPKAHASSRLPSKALPESSLPKASFESSARGAHASSVPCSASRGAQSGVRRILRSAHTLFHRHAGPAILHMSGRQRSPEGRRTVAGDIEGMTKVISGPKGRRPLAGGFSPREGVKRGRRREGGAGGRARKCFLPIAIADAAKVARALPPDRSKTGAHPGWGAGAAQAFRLSSAPLNPFAGKEQSRHARTTKLPITHQSA
jgi:hypothetical protein